MKVVLGLLHARRVGIVHKVSGLGEATAGVRVGAPYLLLTSRIGVWLRKGGRSSGKGTALFCGEVVLILEVEVEM